LKPNLLHPWTKKNPNKKLLLVKYGKKSFSDGRKVNGGTRGQNKVTPFPEGKKKGWGQKKKIISKLQIPKARGGGKKTRGGAPGVQYRLCH